MSKNQSVPGVVVGVGSEIPERSNGGRFRQKFGIRDRFVIYVGRIDENKGCAELFEYFEHYSASLVDGMHLVLIGAPIIPIPEASIASTISASSTTRTSTTRWRPRNCSIMPSYLESLSMVALEAWAMGKPVLANARCEVLQGQCIRSNAGLFYENFQEFSETLRAIDSSPTLQAALGRNGRAFFERHYSWPVVVKKYLDMLERLSKETPSHTMEPMPGWFARRRRTLPPADSIVKQLPCRALPGTGQVGSREPGVGARRREPGAGNRAPASRDRDPSPAATAAVSATARPSRTSAGSDADQRRDQQAPEASGRSRTRSRGARKPPSLKPASPRQASAEPRAGPRQASRKTSADAIAAAVRSGAADGRRRRQGTAAVNSGGAR